MVYIIIFSLVGVLLYLFSFWKKLGEDYTHQQIFSAAFYILFGALLGFVISKSLLGKWWFWFGFLGAFFGFIIGNLKLKIRFYEYIDSLVLAALPGIALIFLGNSILNASLSSFLGFVVLLIFIFLFFYFEAHYKGFAWFKSGKVGFSGLSTLGLFFLVRGLIALAYRDVLSFAGKADFLISLVVSLVCFFLVYNLGKQKT